MNTVEQNAASESLLQLVTFDVAGEEYGVDILSVQEIIRHMSITRLPSAPSYVEGVLNLRGRIIPIIDLRRRFGLAPKDADQKTRIVVFARDGWVVGFLVDSVSEVLRIPADMVEAPPAVTSGEDSRYIRGVGKLQERLLILLDAAQVLSVEELGFLTNQVQGRVEA